MAGTVSNRADGPLSFTIYNMNVHTFCRKFIFQVITEQKVALVSQYFNEQYLSISMKMPTSVQEQILQISVQILHQPRLCFPFEQIFMESN